jgi:hypothetical protein
MEHDRVLGLFKFGKREHMEEFARGNIYMNPLQYFIAHEADDARRDPGEGTALWLQPSVATLSVQIDGEFKPIPGILGPIRFRKAADLEVNIFCMFALRANASKKQVDPRNSEFGDTFAVLKDGDEFLRRVRRRADALNLQPTWGLVEYVSEAEHHGPMGIFRKSSKFSYQSEFRIALRPGTGSPRLLDVGSLEDIVILGPLAEINHRIRIDE